MDSKGAFLHKSPTYELLRKIPKVAGSANYVLDLPNVARTTPFEEPVTAGPGRRPSAQRRPAAGRAPAMRARARRRMHEAVRESAPARC